MRKGFLSATALKLIALIAMIFDHAGDAFFPEQTWMRAIGRMAFPIFAFCVSQGCIHTHDRVSYLKRLLLFGAVSEIPFDLMTSGKLLEFHHQNVMFSFAWALTGVICLDYLRKRVKGNVFYLLEMAVICGFVLGSILLHLDHSVGSVALVMTWFILKDKAPLVADIAAAAVQLLLNSVGVYLWGILGFIPIFLYDGKRGKGLKWLFYIFYPAHMLAIYLIGGILKG